MLVAIHQPNFFPWLGFFDKLARADVFVILDNVALQHTGGNYTNRVRILIQGRPAWLTMPVIRGSEARSRIDLACIAEDASWRQKAISTIRHNYAKAPYFADIMPLIERLLGTTTRSLRDFNLTAIRGIADMVGLKTDGLQLASTLKVKGRATDLLIDIVQAVGGTAYLAGDGAQYQEDDKFPAAGIELRYQRFRPVEYPQLQRDRFEPGLSIIDALMNCGPAETGNMIRHGSVEEART